MDFSQVKKIVIPESDYYMGLLKIKGDTAQQTYSGEQLLTQDGMATPITDTSFWAASPGYVQQIPLGNGWSRWLIGAHTSSQFINLNVRRVGIDNFASDTKYTVIVEIENISGIVSSSRRTAFDVAQPAQTSDPWAPGTLEIITGLFWRDATNVYAPLENGVNVTGAFTATTKNSAALTGYGLRSFFRPEVPEGAQCDLRITILAGDHSSDWQNYVGDNWQPYVGGIPAPNPDYPQPIRTATGRQVVSVNGNDIEMNLGSIELCKIGDYQDRIYYENGKWWLRKEVGKIDLFDQSLNWVYHGGDGHPIYYTTAGIDNIKYVNSNAQTGSGLAEKYRIGPGRGLSNSGALYRIAIDVSQVGVNVGQQPGIPSGLFYYALATPTVTEITESSLLTGLNALLALGRFPKNTPPTITVDSVSPNLPAVVLTDDLLNDVIKIEQNGTTLWEKK